MIFLFLVLIVAYLLLKESDEYGRYYYAIVVTIALVFVSCFRNIWIGNDTYAYLRSMERSVNTPWNDIFSSFFTNYISPSMEDGKDPGYAVFEKLFSTISTNYTLYLFFIAVLVIVPISCFIYNNTSNMKQMLFAYLYYIVMFFIYVPNSAIRQSLAVGFAYIAYRLLQKNRTIAFIIIIIVASTFHKTALICLLFAGFVKLPQSRYITLISIAGFLLVTMLGSALAGYLSGFGDVYDAYARDYFAESGKQRPFLVLVLVAFLYCITLVPEYDEDVKREMKPFIIASAFVMFIVPLVRIDPSYLRLTAYFGIFFSIYVAKALDYISYERSYVFIVIVTIFLIKGISENRYKFNWQQMDVNSRYAYSDSPKNSIILDKSIYVC